MDLRKWQLNFLPCNLGLKSYLWFQIELALVRFWNFRPNCTPLSSITIIYRPVHTNLMTHKWLTIGLKQPRIPEFYTLTKINKKTESVDQLFLGAVVKQSVFLVLACVAGGIRERVSGGGAAIFPCGRSPLGISRAAKPRVKFPPAIFRMVFACRPLLMRQLDKPIRERSVTWNLRFISARNDANARDSSEINPW